ncbi:hypothetical protein [Streptomyces sp. NPDC055055]
MTGYLYQCELARRSWHDPTAEVRMELLDDIEFLDEDKTPRELLQAKHREAAGPLSETGKDIWAAPNARDAYQWRKAWLRSAKGFAKCPGRGPLQLS